MNELSSNIKTMSSTQLGELLNYEKKEVNRKIAAMFQAEIDGGKITPSLDERGYVSEYHLPEIEAQMFAAKWNIQHLRKVVEYFVAKPITQQLTQDQQLTALAHGVIKLTQERDEAIRTKAQIGSKREASAMATASTAMKRVKKLEAQLSTTGTHLSIIAAKLPERIDTEIKDGVQTWRVLKRISENFNHEVIKVTCPRFGQINTYHIEVIEHFKYHFMEF
mgnify:CR=1 FL=1